MKKFLSILLAAVMLFAFAACSGNGGNSSDASQAYKSSLEVLNAIWDKVPTDSRFPSTGGKMDAEGTITEGPGKCDLSDKDSLTYSLLIPEAVQANTDDVASLVHMMNANTFTGAVLHLTSGTAEDAAKELENAIVNNHFMCGFPDKLVILSVGEYVFYAFGKNQQIDSVVSSAKSNLQGEVKVLCDKPIE